MTENSLFRFDQCISCLLDTGWTKWYGVWLIEGRGMMGCICTVCYESLKEVVVPEEEKQRAIHLAGRFPGLNAREALGF